MARFFDALARSLAPRRRDCGTPYLVVDVLAHTSEAARVRHAVSGCPDAGVLRCIPLQSGGRVRLQIRCPAAAVGRLMQAVMAGSTAAEFGRTATWTDHLATYQQSRHS